MKKTHFLLALLIVSASMTVFAQNVTVTVNTAVNKKTVSPYIYGRNESFDKSATFYKNAGLRFARTNGGNNATKYNWRKKITSHPDWYNNVYDTDWDAMSKKFATYLPGVQVMWAFQLMGKVASNKNNNFNDWSYNQSQWWAGVNQNLAGGGTPNTSGTNTGKAAVEGDDSKYLVDWPADSTVEILNHWFGSNGIGLNKNQFIYWNMDNETDIWDGTHDDAMPTLITASDFMDRFIEVAKKARALFPGIKICGPVTTSEWQWYKWGSQSIWINGKYYSWMEYFIKRCADEEQASGIRVLDVLDLHNYPYANTDQEALQLHRMYYDKNYVYPGANGVKTINGGWDNSQTKEYIFQRINDWLNTHYGSNHGITLGISEWGPSTSGNANVNSVVYGSALGTFANNGVELFSPWIWDKGMWETLHLYSRYGKKYSVSSTSSLENTVSAYTTVNQAADSMTVIIVNRDMNSSRNVTVNLNGFSPASGSASTLQLSSLPSTETFVSHTNNALKSNSVTVNSNSFSITVPALSTTAVLLKSAIPLAPTVISPVSYCQNAAASALSATGSGLLWYPDPTGGTGSAVAPTPSTSTAGTTNYYVSQTVNAIEGPRATIEVIVYSPSSSANAGSDQNITSFTTGLLANPPITGTGSWTVVSGTANFADDSNPNTNVSGLSTGDNTLKWTISNGPCSPSSDEVIIHTESAPMTQGISGPVNVIANTQGVTYSIPNDSGATFSWSVPSDAVIVSGQGTNSIVVDFGTQGGTVEVTETNSFGSAVSSATVAVGNAPVTQTISGPANVVSGTNGVNYSVSSNSGSSYTWTIPSGAAIVSGQGTNSIVVDFGTQGGTVGVTETNSFGSAVSSAAVAVGNAPVTQTISGPANVASGTSGVSYSVSSNSGSSFTWTIPSGAAIVSGQGTNSIVVDFGTSGGTISVTQTNAFGSANSSMLVEMTITGITSIDLVDIEVYPNPFSDELSLKSNIASGSTLTLKMIDMKGDIIYETDNCPTAKPIILPKALPTGIYMVLIIHNKGMKTVKLEKK